MAAMENLKYPPECSPYDRAAVRGTPRREGSSEAEAVRSKSSNTSEHFPLKVYPTVLYIKRSAVDVDVGLLLLSLFVLLLMVLTLILLLLLST